MAVGLGTLTLNLIAQTGLFTQGLNRAEQQTRTSARNMSNELNLVGRTLKDLQGTLMASFASVLTIGTAISKMDAYTGLQNRLKLVTASQTELNQALKDTFSIAQATGQAWDSTAQVYQRFADNAKRLGITLQQTAELTDTVAKAIAISGGSAASAEAALVQFGQALASGVLRGEEFNSISEQAPGLLKAIATGLGVNIGQLRAMAAEGQLTAEVVIKSLGKAKGSVNDLFGKTDFTIANSFTMLNNAVIQFVGEAGKGSGAAQVLSGSIKGLADNLDVLTNVAMVGAAFYAGTFIPTIYTSVTAGYAKTKQLIEQTAVQYATINAERAAAAQALANAQATVVNTQATLAALAAEKALEVERLKAQINQAGRIATATRMAQLRRIEVQVTAELTAAETALAAARTRSTAAAAMSTRVGAGLVGVLGGPVGLGLTVASIAAGYLLMRGNGDQANKMLGEQSRYASLATEELGKLSGAQLKAAEKELSKELTLQSGHLQKAKNDFEALTESILDSNKGNQEAYKIWAELRTGVITTEQAFNKLNQAKFVTPEQINALTDSRTKVAQSEESIRKLNEQLNKTRESGANAAGGLKAIGMAADETKVSIEVLNKALGKLTDQRTDSQYVMNTAKNLGGDIEKAKALLEYRKQLGLGSVGRQLTPQERKPFEDSYAALRALKAYEDNIAESKKASLKLSKQQTSEYEKQQKKLEQIKEQQKRDREDIKYLYGNAFNKDEMNLDSELKRINEAGFSPEHRQGYINAALSRAKINQELFVAEQEFEINQFQYTEEQKLAAEFALNKRRVDANFDLNDQMIEAHKASLEEQYKNAVAWAELEKQQRLLDARQFYMSDAEYMQERYKLERDEIAKNMQLTQQERDARIAMLHAEEEYEKRKNLRSASIAWGQTSADMNGSGAFFQLEQDRFNRYDESQALFDSQMALAETAAEREAIWQAHNDRMLAIDEDYQTRSNELSLNYGEQITASFADMFKTIGGEQSAAYKLMFAAQKGFAIAQSIMAIQTGIANAMALPFPANLGAAATVAAESASIIANIQAVTLTGMAHDGIASIPEEGTWLLNKGERVLNPQDNKAFTDFINSQSSGEPNITINNNTGANVSASRGVDGRVYVTIDEVDQLVAQSIGHPSSKTSKAMNQFTNAGRRR
jgi:tape measure domain-containing protein